LLEAQVTQVPATNAEVTVGPGAPNDVFRAKNVREVATSSGTTADHDHWLDQAKTTIANITARFNGTLVGTNGKDSSPLTLRAFLAAPITEGSTRVWSPVAQYALLHVVQFGGRNSVYHKWVLAHRVGQQTEVSDSLHILGAKSIAVIFLRLKTGDVWVCKPKMR
jgi:hypothetical protein